MWSAADLQALVEEAAAAHFDAFRLRVVPNVNIQAWLFLRRLFDLGRPLPGLTHVQRLALQPVYPWLASRLHQAPTYRKIVFCQPGR